MVSRKKVLVIEDERPIAEPLADALRREGFDVHLAATAADGLEAFSAQAPDIVLLDVMLPDGDGRDVLRQIRHAIAHAGRDGQRARGGDGPRARARARRRRLRHETVQCG